MENAPWALLEADSFCWGVEGTSAAVAVVLPPAAHKQPLSFCTSAYWFLDFGLQPDVQDLLIGYAQTLQGGQSLRKGLQGGGVAAAATHEGVSVPAAAAGPADR